MIELSYEPIKTQRQEAILDLSEQLDIAANKLYGWDEMDQANKLSVIANDLFNEISIELIPPAP